MGSMDWIGLAREEEWLGGEEGERAKRGLESAAKTSRRIVRHDARQAKYNEIYSFMAN